MSTIILIQKKKRCEINGLSVKKKEDKKMIKDDVKITLSALWIARMLSGLQGDVVRFMGPGVIEELSTRTGDWETVTSEMLLVMSIMFVVTIFMTFLSIALKDKANRRANLGIGIFFAGIDVAFLIVSFIGQAAVYEIFWGFVYLVFTAMVVWYAWKWPKQES